MTENNINLLKQIFWKLYKEKNMLVDITKAKVYADDESMAVVDFDNFGVLLYKDTEKISIIPNY